MFRLEDVNENVSSNGNHNLRLGWLVGCVPVMADSSWPHTYDAIDDDLQQEHNNHGEGVL